MTMFAELKFKVRCYLNRNKDMELQCPQCEAYFSGDYMGYSDAGGCFQPEDLANYGVCYCCNAQNEENEIDEEIF